MLLRKTSYMLFTGMTIFLFNACGLPSPASPADPNAFNTMVAQTAQVQFIQMTQTALGHTQPPNVAPPAIVLPTQGTPSAFSMSLPRGFAIDLDTQTIWGDISSQASPPRDVDIFFYAPYPDQPDWQFLKTANNAGLAYFGEQQPTQQECSTKLSNAADNLPLDSSLVNTKAYYGCFRTSQGRIGFILLSSPTASYSGMPTVNIAYTFWTP
jgi:hypothetical protein